MKIFETPLARIDFHFIEQLVRERVDESMTHDYKVQIPDPRDQAGRLHLYKSASAFANTEGGILIFGVDAPAVKDWCVPGLERFDADRDAMDLINLLRQNTEPPLPYFHPRTVEAADGRRVFLLGIPRSFSAPHRVRNDFFWRRAPRNNYPMTVSELRRAFDEAEGWRRDVDAFFKDRWEFILDHRFIGDIGWDTAAMYLHVLPLGRLRNFVDLTELARYWKGKQVIAGDVKSDEQRHNVDGWIRVVRSHPDDMRFVQAYRHGGTEWFWTTPSFSAARTSNLDGREIDLLLFKRIQQSIEAMRRVGVAAPYLLQIRVQRSPGYSLSYIDGGRTCFSTGFDRDVVQVPAIVLEEEPESPEKLAAAIRPLLDALWQSSGFERDPFFDAASGSWELLEFAERYR